MRPAAAGLINEALGTSRALRATGLSTVPSRRPLSMHRNVDSVAREMIPIAQNGNTSYRGVELVRDVSGKRVKPPGPQFCGIGSRSSGRGVKRREFDDNRALRSCTDVGSASPDAECAEGGALGFDLTKAQIVSQARACVGRQHGRAYSFDEHTQRCPVDVWLKPF